MVINFRDIDYFMSNQRHKIVSASIQNDNIPFYFKQVLYKPHAKA